MPRVWTEEQRKAAGERLRAGRQHQQVLKHSTAFIADADALIDAEIQPGPLASLPDQHRDLIRWVGRAIRTLNANGRRSDKFCKLCSASRLLKEPCRHAEIWRLAER